MAGTFKITKDSQIFDATTAVDIQVDVGIIGPSGTQTVNSRLATGDKPEIDIENGYLSKNGAVVGLMVFGYEQGGIFPYSGAVSLDWSGNNARATFISGDGDDILRGGGSGDTMSGGAGNDVFYAAGGDVVTGGTGNDTIHVSMNDGVTEEIKDFSVGDTLVLSGNYAHVNGWAVDSYTVGSELFILTTRPAGTVWKAVYDSGHTTLTAQQPGPTVSISLEKATVMAGQAATATFTFSNAPTAFDASDITAENGAISNLTQSSSDPKVWTAIYTPTAGVNDTSNVLKVGADWHVGNQAPAGETSSGSFAVNTVRPTATVSMEDTSLKAGETGVAKITYSDDPLGFDPGDVTIEAGTYQMMGYDFPNVDPKVMYILFTPTADTEDTINSITFGTGWTSLAGNCPLSPAFSPNYVIDTKLPAFSQAGSSHTIDGGKSVLTAKFSEAVKLGTAGNIIVRDIAANTTLATIPYNDAAVTGWGTDTLTVATGVTLPTGKNLSVQWDGDVFQDNAGNAAVANATDTLFAFTITPPSSGGSSSTPPSPTSPTYTENTGATRESSTATTDHTAAQNAVGGMIGTRFGASDQAAITAASGRFIDGVPSGTTVAVETIVTSDSASSVAIDGKAADGAVTMLIVDASAMSTGKSVSVTNANFVMVKGAVGVVSGDAADNMVGDSAAQSFTLAGGDDDLTAGNGQDLVYGNQGQDLVYGNQGTDTLFGGKESDEVYGGQDNDDIEGNLGDDELLGNLGEDAVYGNQGQDFVYGNQGTDTLFGGKDNDILFGGQDDDFLFGNLGNDQLEGDLGNDVVSGGEGADRFVFRAGDGHDTVSDFSFAQGDRLVINGRPYTVMQNATSEAVITFADGTDVTLSGIGREQVTVEWFMAA